MAVGSICSVCCDPRHSAIALTHIHVCTMDLYQATHFDVGKRIWHLGLFAAFVAILDIAQSHTHISMFVQWIWHQAIHFYVGKRI